MYMINEIFYVYLMLSRIVMNLSVPSSAGGNPGSFLSHPISSADPRTVLRARSTRLNKQKESDQIGAIHNFGQKLQYRMHLNKLKPTYRVIMP